MESTRAYPLYWPEGWPRATFHKVAKFGDHSVKAGRTEIARQVALFDARELIISTNLELRTSDGLPRSNQRQPADRGVAIYFKRGGVDMALACDVYTTIEDNLWALARTLDALRQIERDGSPSLINRAFKGFAQLPDPDRREWWEVLNVARTASNEEIRSAYLRLAKQYHPDAGGDAKMFDQVQKAYDLATGKKVHDA
jgi:hypothetical protein